MIVSIFVFAIAGLHAWWILVLTRIVGIPIIIGVSFELIKWAGTQPGSPLGAGDHVPRPAASAADDT